MHGRVDGFRAKVDPPLCACSHGHGPGISVSHALHTSPCILLYVSSLQRGILARSMTSFPPSPCVFLYRPVLLGLAHLAPSDTSRGADNGSTVTPCGVIGPRLPDSTASMFTTGFLCPRHLSFHPHSPPFSVFYPTGQHQLINLHSHTPKPSYT